MLSMSPVETEISTALLKVVAIQLVVALDVARKGKSISFPCSSLECPYLRTCLYFSMGSGFSIPIVHIRADSCLRITIPRHNKAECPNEAIAREFTGTCRVCEQVGHRASDCPNKPPEVCKNCQQEGHGPLECKNPRKIDRSKLPELEPDLAWEKIKEAVADRDLEDVKDAVQVFLRAVPDTTYAELERAFRQQNMGIYLICVEKELQPTYTNSRFSSVSCSFASSASTDAFHITMLTKYLKWTFRETSTRSTRSLGVGLTRLPVQRRRIVGQPVRRMLSAC